LQSTPITNAGMQLLCSDVRAEDCSKPLAELPTVNLTILKGGVAYNVVPGECEAGFDFRIPPSYDLAQFFEDTIAKWKREISEDLKVEFISHTAQNKITALTEENKWWCAFRSVFEEGEMPLRQEIFTAATDSRFLRLHGIPVLGFSPMINTPILLHDHNEFLNENVYLDGIRIYERIIPRLASLQ
jgi:aminoacylase